MKIMSDYKFCPSGGQTGIFVSDEELNSFADAIGSKALDGTIPLPNLTLKEQKTELILCVNHDDTEYWERDNGKHGWCCSNCGTVTQWG